MTKREYYCSCCGDKIKHSGNMKEYAWQVDGCFNVVIVAFLKSLTRDTRHLKQMYMVVV